MGCESSEVFVTEWVLFLNHCSQNMSLISDNLREVSRFEYLPNENDRRRWVGHAVVARLKRRPIHVCICTGGNAHVDCKRRSVLVMPLVFFFPLPFCSQCMHRLNDAKSMEARPNAFSYLKSWVLIQEGFMLFVKTLGMMMIDFVC